MEAEKIRRATVRIQCCSEYKKDLNINDEELDTKVSIGTGFFIDTDKVITATHVIDGYYSWNDNIYIEALNIGRVKPIKAIPINQGDEKKTVTILQLEEKVEVEGLKFTYNYTVKDDDEWEAFGYPADKWNNGHRQGGHVSHRLYENRTCDSNYDLNYNPGEINNFSGLSGAAFIINEMLLGIMIEQSLSGANATSLGVITIDQYQDYIPKEYQIKDKHKEQIKQYLKKYTEEQINKNKLNKKYIPDIFVEIGSIKEKLRFFSNPTLFFEKIIEDIEYYRFESLNSYLRKANLNEFEIKLPKDLKTDITLDNIYLKAEKLCCILDKAIEEGKSREKIYSSKERYIYLNAPRTEWKLKQLKEMVAMFSYKYILLTEKAGQGKTNLLCDFTEKVLLSNEINCIYVNANELNELTIDEYITKKILNILGYTLDVFLSNIRDICEREKVPFVILIDGLNENSNINRFKVDLESFISAIEKYNYIKVVMTCRTEYFEQRFGNLVEASFSSKLYHFSNFNRINDEEFKERLVEGYFNFFNLSQSSIRDSALKKLSDDMLLLRVFCEAYGDSVAKNKIILPPIYDIYKFDVFEKYFQFKLEEIDRKKQTIEEINNSELYKLLIHEIIQNMIEKKQFSNIPLNAIKSDNAKKLLHTLIDEDIIFKEDIVVKKGLLEETENTISFTFDEFRDYNIARYIMEKYGEIDSEEYSSLIKLLTNEKYEISEGLAKYLFFASKKYKDPGFESIIKQQEWYKVIYCNNIFAVNDEDIVDEDVERIKKGFTKSIKIADYFISELLKRYDISVFRKLGINQLFQMMLELDKKLYNEYIRVIFDDYVDYYGYIQRRYKGRTQSITQYIYDLYPMLKREQGIKAEHSLFEFLLFIIDIGNEGVELYKEYYKKYPNEGLTSIEELIKEDNEIINNNLVQVIDEIKDIYINEDIKRRIDIILNKIEASNEAETFDLKEFLRQFGIEDYDDNGGV